MDISVKGVAYQAYQSQSQRQTRPMQSADEIG